ncbi:hypothetical protein LIER_27681 [Lithospermum erythrorhizon]|uniref:Uncharacterized protein n=1 Tax=Lithospermum erythrorhizon TaxID=34254 RepID=A0AAV3RGZ9_LITER
MDEQGISSIFEDRLNPSLYDKQVYLRECPYVKVASPKPRLESHVIRSCEDESSGDESSLSANSPIPQVMVGNQLASKITPNDDVENFAPIKGAFPL